MSYQATVINVMIASPTDVEEEPAIVRDVVHQWNSVNSEDTKIILMPLDWKTDSFPLMGSTGQQVINDQVLNRADLLIAIFWTKIGSPTIEAESGTIEEIEKHLQSGKPTMIYLSSIPVVLESVNMDEFKVLQEFKKDLQKRGLIEKYDSLADFRDKLNQQLARIVIQKFKKTTIK